MISKKIKEKYFVEEVSQITEDLSGWKVLGMTKSSGNNFELKTTLNGWLDEFRIRYQRLNHGLGMILVDPDCSELYILNSEDIKELVEECIFENPYTDYNYDDFIDYLKVTDGSTTVTSSPNDSITWTVSTNSYPTWICNNNTIDTTVATYTGASAINTAKNYIATDYLNSLNSATPSALASVVNNANTKSIASC